jgi:hypothetical protein
VSAQIGLGRIALVFQKQIMPTKNGISVEPLAMEKGALPYRANTAVSFILLSCTRRVMADFKLFGSAIVGHTFAECFSSLTESICVDS